MSHDTTWCHTMLYDAIYCHMMLHGVMWCHVMSCEISWQWCEYPCCTISQAVVPMCWLLHGALPLVTELHCPGCHGSSQLRRSHRTSMWQIVNTLSLYSVYVGHLCLKYQSTQLLSPDGRKKTFHYSLTVPTTAPCIAFAIGWASQPAASDEIKIVQYIAWWSEHAYQRLLEITKEYWRLLEITRDYLQIVMWL